MSKQTKSTPAAGHVAAKQARKPSKPVVSTPSAPAPTPAPVAAPAPVAVALRGGLAVAAVRFTGKQYRVGADHNAGWWALIVGTMPAGDAGTVPVADLVKQGVPARFVGYCIRRGYLASA